MTTRIQEKEKAIADAKTKWQQEMYMQYQDRSDPKKAKHHKQERSVQQNTHRMKGNAYWIMHKYGSKQP